MLTTELCARLCADFPLQLPDAPACFACTRVVLDPWDDAEGGTVFIGEGTVDRPDRFSLLCAPGAPQHPNAAHYANPALTLRSTGLLPVVLSIEAGEPPEELVARHRLPELCAWYESVGAEALVLGCTHFPYFKEVLARQIRLPILDPAEEMLRLLDA